MSVNWTHWNLHDTSIHDISHNYMMDNTSTTTLDIQMNYVGSKWIHWTQMSYIGPKWWMTHPQLYWPHWNLHDISHNYMMDDTSTTTLDTQMNYVKPKWITLNPNELHWTQMSYIEPKWIKSDPNDGWHIHNYNNPTGTSMTHPTIIWWMIHPQLHWTPKWTTLNPNELHWIQMNYIGPKWVTLNPNE